MLKHFLVALVLTACGGDPQNDPEPKECPAAVVTLSDTSDPSKCWAVVDDCHGSCKVHKPGDTATLVVPGKMIEVSCGIKTCKDF